MTDKPSFEKDLEALEKIVQELEEGDLALDVSLQKFELGITLTKRCEKALTDAEKRIDVLVKNAMGEVAAEPFEDPGAADDTAQPKRRPRRRENGGEASGEASSTAGGDEDEDGELLF
jgi:exodeoxyribonuclease VII small subunit